MTRCVSRGVPWLIALGLLLPTMHQSSLGSLIPFVHAGIDDDDA